MGPLLELRVDMGDCATVAAAPATAPAMVTTVVMTVVVARPVAVSLFSVGRKEAVIVCWFLTIFHVVASVDLELFQFNG